ncbi:MAG: amphi-Trp domain-containing protein [Halioglobus sp.]|nr:amphi-Trp domain-containing protein [Halioglobus sp.]
MSREQAAGLLRELADSLARHNGVDLMQGGMKVQVRVPDRVEVEFEVELKKKKSSLEIEISW